MNRSYNRMKCTNIGAVVFMVQAGLTLCFALYFLEQLMSYSKLPNNRDRTVLHHLTKEHHTLFVVMLFFLGSFHVAWIGSSIYLLFNNRNGNQKSISLHLMATALICLADIVFPFIVLPTTYNVFAVALVGQTIHDDRSEVPIYMNPSDYGNYFWLIMTFIRGGCFTFGIDVFFMYVGFQRLLELSDLRKVLRGNKGLGARDHQLQDFLDKTNNELDIENEPETFVVPSKPVEKQSVERSAQNDDNST